MVLKTFAEYAAHERLEGLSDEVLHDAKRAVIDWFAAALPGGLEPPSTLLANALAGELGHGRARVYASTGASGPARTAALINATAAHTIEFDDIFRDAVYHPGCVTVAAALALGQERGARGVELLRAVVVGYEVSTRIGVAVNPDHYRFWHTTGTVGSFGAAAASAAMLGLGVGETLHALATSGTFAAGLQQAFRSDCMSKPLHAGHAAEVGVLAALAAEQGVTGAPDILEGERGFGNAMSRDCDWVAATAGLGREYNISRMTFKNHGCCGHTFAAIDGILELREAHDVVVEDVERIEVGTYGTAVEVTGRFEPEAAFEAKFSLPYVVCTALVHGSVRRDAFSDDRLADPVVRDLMRRFELTVDPELDAAFPGRRAAALCIHMRDGRRLEYLQPTRKGDPDAPLSDREMEEKFKELVGPVIGSRGAGELVDSLWALDRLEASEIADLAINELSQAVGGSAWAS